MPDFDSTWDRIQKNAGKTFRQIRGKEFTYSADNNGIRPDTTNQLIPKSHIQKALNLVPLMNTVPLQKKFRGPAFLYAILMDKRIREDEW